MWRGFKSRQARVVRRVIILSKATLLCVNIIKLRPVESIRLSVIKYYGDSLVKRMKSLKIVVGTPYKKQSIFLFSCPEFISEEGNLYFTFRNQLCTNGGTSVVLVLSEVLF